VQSSAQAVLDVARQNPGLLDDTLNVTEALLQDAHAGLTRIAANKQTIAPVEEMLKAIQRKDFPDVVLTTAGKGWDMLYKSNVGRKPLLQEGDILVERQMHEAFKRLYQMKTERVMLGRTFGALTDLFKTYATLSPGFHVRNALSAIFMNTADGVPLKLQWKGAQLWRRYMHDDGVEWLRNLSADDLAEFGIKATPRQVQEAFNATFMSGAGGRFLESGFAEGRGKMARALNNPATRLSQRVGQRVEGSVRLGMALDSVIKGDTLDGAYSRLARVHFDYADVSKFDQAAKKFVPFWTFLSRNLPLQVSEMWHRPGLYTSYQHFVDNMGQKNEMYTPEYWLQAGAFNTGLKVPDIPGLGGAQGLPLYLSPEVGPYQINQQIGDLTEAFSGRNPGALLSQFNPLFTAPAEFVAGKDFYTGKKYEAADVSGKTMNLLRSVTPLMDRTSRLLPQLTGGGTDAKQRQLESIARFLGAPVRTLTPKQQTNEYWRRYYDWLDKHKADLAKAKAG
jgi:hypothetical protein